MNDIFLSYARSDLPRVQPVRDALAQRGFSVAWDQEVPAGRDWDAWIRERLSESRCVIVLWSAGSIRSDNVKHEAFIAKQQNKLIPVTLDPIEPGEFPLGLYTTQATSLAGWGGDVDQSEWRKLVADIETTLAPPWVVARLEAVEAELRRERARRDEAERQAQAAREQGSQDSARHHAHEPASRPGAAAGESAPASPVALSRTGRVRLSLTEFTILWTAITAVVWGFAWVIGLFDFGPRMSSSPGLPGATLFLTGLVGGLCNSVVLFFRTRAIGIGRLIGLTLGWTVAMIVGGAVLNSWGYEDPQAAGNRDLVISTEAAIVCALSSASVAAGATSIALRWTTRFIGWGRTATISGAWALCVVSVILLTYWRTPPERQPVSVFLAPVGALVSAAAQVLTILVYREPSGAPVTPAHVST